MRNRKASLLQPLHGWTFDVIAFITLLTMVNLGMLVHELLMALLGVARHYLARCHVVSMYHLPRVAQDARGYIKTEQDFEKVMSEEESQKRIGAWLHKFRVRGDDHTPRSRSCPNPIDIENITLSAPGRRGSANPTKTSTLRVRYANLLQERWPNSLSVWPTESTQTWTSFTSEGIHCCPRCTCGIVNLWRHTSKRLHPDGFPKQTFNNKRRWQEHGHGSPASKDAHGSW